MLLVLIMDLIWQHAKYENNIYRLIHLHTHSYVNTIPAEASLLGHRGIPLASFQKKKKINRRHIDKSVTFWSEDDGFNKLSWPLTTESGVKKLNIISILLISGTFICIARVTVQDELNLIHHLFNDLNLVCISCLCIVRWFKINTYGVLYVLKYQSKQNLHTCTLNILIWKFIIIQCNV